jgi:NADPH2:quinone reductase
MMKAVVVREHGDAKSALLLELDYPKPTAPPGHALIENKFAGLNFIDTYYRSGLYQQPLPFISGQEGGGTIVEINSKTPAQDEFHVGDTVVYMQFGSCAQYTAVPLDKLVKVPNDISLQLAVACMTQGLTAHYLVTDAPSSLIKSGEWCLIYSVASGTTQWAAQMAKLQGYKVIGTTSRTKQAQAEEEGTCDELIVLDTVEGKTYADYTSTGVDIAQRVLQITNQQGVKLILDGVGAATADISIKCLAQRGIWISFGNASGPVPPFSLLRLTPKSAYCTRPKLGDYVATRDELLRRSHDVFTWLQQGKIHVSVDKVFHLEDIVKGHEYLESGQSKGKILFEI